MCVLLEEEQQQEEEAASVLRATVSLDLFFIHRR